MFIETEIFVFVANRQVKTHAFLSKKKKNAQRKKKIVNTRTQTQKRESYILLYISLN